MTIIIKIVLLGVFLVFNLNINAQQQLNFVQADVITYNQYLRGEWQELIKTGKTYLKYGETFYYLQIRMGIAYYHLKKYRKAIIYLSKAYEKHQNNDLLSEYLYYAYIFSGRMMDAKKLSEHFDYDLRKKLGINNERFIDAITFNVRFEKNKDYFVGLNNSDLLKQAYRKDFSYFDFGMEHIFGEDKRIYWNFSKINKSLIVYDVGDNNEQTNNNLYIKQNQFYISFYKQLNYGLNFKIASNILNIVYISEDPVVSLRYVSNEIVLFSGIHKDIGNFKLGFKASIGNLYKNFQFQPGLDFTYYPFANTNFYFSIFVDYKVEKDNAQWSNSPIIRPVLGVKLFNIYFEPSYTFGQIINYVDKEALVIYNDNDVMKNLFEITVFTYLFKGKLSVFVKYQNYIKTNTYFLNNIEQSVDYLNQTYTGGIKWNF